MGILHVTRRLLIGNRCTGIPTGVSLTGGKAAEAAAAREGGSGGVFTLRGSRRRRGGQS